VEGGKPAIATRTLLLPVLVLTLLGGAALWWLREASIAAVDVAQLELEFGSGLSGDSLATTPEIPGAVPQPPAESNQLRRHVAPEDSRAAEFENKYQFKNVEELRKAELRVRKQLHKASVARMDQLFLNFPRHLAQGEYDACVLPASDLTALADIMPRNASYHAGLRIGVSADGAKESRFLAFDPSEEPATAAIFREQRWLQARLEPMVQ
jgi:hypothetical protein